MTDGQAGSSIEEVDAAGRMPDVSDRATFEEIVGTQEAVRKQLERARQKAGPPPREDGECACGCGAEVPEARRALGYGITVFCQQKREKLDREYGR